MICCRYLKFAYWLSSVGYGQFKVSKPSDFEDGYDCAAYADGEIDLEVIRKFSKSPDDSLMNYDVQRTLLAADRTMTDFYEQRQLSFASNFSRLLLRRGAIDKYLRILCFCDDSKASEEDRHKMWEKYGDDFRGVRVFVDLDKVIGGEYKEISYAETIPCCDLSQIDNFPICQYLMGFYKKMVFTKLRKEWSFENEIRYIFDVTESRQRQILYVDGKLEFVTIPFDALMRVDFGYDVNLKSCVNDIRRLVNSSLHQVEFRRMIERSGKNSVYEPL